MLPAISLIVMAETIIPHTHAARQAQEFGIISCTMPQNKSTSRIAAITGKLAVALAALLAPAILIAETINVTFDAALTNATEWVYDPAVKIATGNHVYFNSGNTSITSPAFPFVITNISLDLSCSSTTPARKLIIRLPDNHEIEIPYVHEKDKHEQKTFNIDAGNHFRSFAISTLTGNSGSWHLYSAVISGVPLIEAPTNLQSDEIKGTRCRLSWENPENAVSNKIEVAEVAWHEESGDKVIRHTFDEFSNKGDTKDKTEHIVEKYPDLSDSILLCYPTNSAGQIQISQESDKGILVHKGLDSYYKMSLSLRLRRYQGDNDSMSVQWIASNGSTNDLKTVSLSDNFTTEVTALSDVDPDAPLVLNALGNKTKHRIIIDEMSFIRDYSPASVSTNLVKTVFATGNTSTIRGLSPYSSYIASITAFDADGNESEPSEPISFMTNGAELPLVIRLQ